MFLLLEQPKEHLHHPVLLSVCLAEDTTEQKPIMSLVTWWKHLFSKC